MTTPTVRIRPAGAARAYVVVFGVVWCGLAASAVVRSAQRGTPAVVVVGALVLVLGAVVVWRMARLGADSDGDRLTVRNGLSTRVLARSEVEDVRTGAAPTGGFRIGLGGGVPLGSSVLLLLRDGTVLPVQGARTRLLGSGRAQTDQVDQLRAWLGAGAIHRPAHDERPRATLEPPASE